MQKQNFKIDETTEGVSESRFGTSGTKLMNLFPWPDERVPSEDERKRYEDKRRKK